MERLSFGLFAVVTVAILLVGGSGGKVWSVSRKRSKESKKVDDATKRGKAIRQRIADVEKRLAAVTAENDRLRKDVSTLKAQRQNAVADGVAETQDLRNKIRALENENRSLSGGSNGGGGTAVQVKQQQQGFHNFQLRNIGKADEEENKRLKAQLKTLESENRALKRAAPAKGWCGWPYQQHHC